MMTMRARMRFYRLPFAIGEEKKDGNIKRSFSIVVKIPSEEDSLGR